MEQRKYQSRTLKKNKGQDKEKTRRRRSSGQLNKIDV
jgi:hypothetical protein